MTLGHISQVDGIAFVVNDLDIWNQVAEFWRHGEKAAVGRVPQLPENRTRLENPGDKNPH